MNELNIFFVFSIFLTKEILTPQLSNLIFLLCSIEQSLSNEHTHTNNSIQSQELKTTENGGEYVHRLVQDENAKTILLNVPLEINSTSGGELIVDIHSKSRQRNHGMDLI